MPRRSPPSRRNWEASAVGLLVASAFITPRASLAQVPDQIARQQPANTPDQVLLQALASNPLTAPYGFATATRRGQLVLRGTVGTKAVHDAAIRTAIDLGIPVIDELVIDTAAVTFGVAPAVAIGTPAAGLAVGGVVPAYPAMPWPTYGAPDDPYFGFPPVISYPPWWGAMSARRLRETALDAVAAAAAAPVGEAGDPAPDVKGGSVEMTLDGLGIARLRGRVPTLAHKLAIAQKAAGLPGVAGVINNLQVDPNAPGDDVTLPPEMQPNGPEIPGDDEVPPPRPVPFDRDRGPEAVPAPPDDGPPPPPRPVPFDREPAAAAPRREAPAPVRPSAFQPSRDGAVAPASGGISADTTPLARAVRDRLLSDSDLSDLPIRVTSRDGSLTLAGTVPSAYEAMLAYRSAQRTPGVRAIVDRLEFPPPNERLGNSLIDRGRAEDVEPYLIAQLRRHLGDDARIDRLRVEGDRIEVRGSVSDRDDEARATAIVRSLPLLRGYEIDASFATR